MPFDQDRNLANKRLVMKRMQAIADADANGLRASVEDAYPADARWRGSHPFNERNGPDDIAAVWAGLKRAVPDLERRDAIVVGGHYDRDDTGDRDGPGDRDGTGSDPDGGEMVACMGHYVGRWENEWLGMPPSGGILVLRYGEVHRLEGGAITLSSCLWDVLDAMHQCGPMARGFHPLAPSYGTEMTWAPPFTGNGVVLDRQDAEQGEASLAQTLAMHKTLADYDDTQDLSRESLIGMRQREFWHPKMMWYGPAGIGTGRGLAGFVDAHQLPFRRTFPNRQGGAQIADRTQGGHYVRIGDGSYSVTGGWPSVRATHGGGPPTHAAAPFGPTAALFGSGPTDRPIQMRVMDFYLHHEGLIRENWVPIDVPHILLQMGIDVFKRMADQMGEGRLGLKA